MAAIRSTGNKTEAALRSAVHRLGLRFRKNDTRIPGRPDIVFPRAGVAVFVDGDYWHGRFLREAGRAAMRSKLKGRPNSAYWLAKFTGNVARDKRVTRSLQELGWCVLRYWESDLGDDLGPALREVARIVKRRQASARLSGCGRTIERRKTR
jgi:DNA mismatch endonuclease (patch repair protein)